MSKWEKVRLGDVATVLSGSTPRTNEPSYWDGDINWVTPAEISDDTIYIYETQRKITKKAITDGSMRIMPRGTILLTSRAPIGKVAIAGTDMYCNQGFKNLLCSDSVFNKYLFWYLKGKKDYLDSLGRGVTFKELSKNIVENIIIPLPPLHVQKQIACEFDTVSEMLALRKQQLVELNQLIRSLFYKMFGNPIDNEHGWEKKSISEISVINPHKSELGNLADDARVSFVPMNSVSETGEIDTSQTREFHEVKTGYTYFRENDVLFAKITPCMENGKGAVARNLCNGIGFGSTEFHVLRPIEDMTDSEWLYRLTSLPFFRTLAEKNMTGSAGQKRVPASFFDKLRVGLPPLTLQQKYADIVNQIETKKSLVRQSIDETQRLFDSLMSKYFDD